MRYKFRTFRSNPLARVFLLCPHYTISFVLLLSLSGQFDSGASDGSVRRFADLSKDNRAAQCTAVLGLAFSFFVFDFARSPTDAKPPDDCLCGRCPGVRQLRARCEPNCGPSCVGLGMPCKMSCTSSRLSSPLVSAVSYFVQVVLSQHGHRLQ